MRRTSIQLHWRIHITPQPFAPRDSHLFPFTIATTSEATAFDDQVADENCSPTRHSPSKRLRCISNDRLLAIYSTMLQCRMIGDRIRLLRQRK